MPVYAYRAVDARGHRLRGSEDAATEQDLMRVLERRGLLVLAVVQASRQGRGAPFGRRRGLLEATRSMASLLAAGLPLSRALAVAGGLASREVAAALDSVRGRVERGDPVHVALATHPRLFDPVYVGIIRAGELSGDLAGAFGRLEIHLDREHALRAKLVSASVYPLILALAGGAAVLVLTLVVLPRFADLLTDSGVDLPRSTAAVLAVGGLALDLWPVLLVGLAILVAAAAGFLSTPAGGRAGSRALLTIPLVRSLRREALSGRFSRLTGALVAGGAPLLQTLKEVAASIGDPVARDEVIRIRARIREGASLHQALKEGALFPPLLSQLVAVGEESGRLGAFLAKAAEVFEERVAHATQRLATLAEPAMILGFGAVVGLVALSLLQAIYGVNAGALR